MLTAIQQPVCEVQNQEVTGFHDLLLMAKLYAHLSSNFLQDAQPVYTVPFPFLQRALVCQHVCPV